MKLDGNLIYIGEVSKKKKVSNGSGMIVNLEKGTIALGRFKNGYSQFKADLEGDFVIISDLDCSTKNKETINVGRTFKTTEGKTA